VVFFLGVLFFLVAETILMVLLTWIGTLISVAILALFLYSCRNIKSLRYDGNFLYVRGPFKSETIPLEDVSSVNIPDAWDDKVFQIELRSGRLIQFIPNFAPELFVWQKSGIPNNVRRFQTHLTNFHNKLGEGREF
jgi:hypothetical protein